MKYMLAIIGEEMNWDDVSPEQMRDRLKAWDDYTRDLRDAGAFVAGEGLAPSATATTIRIGEERVVTDGPYAETKEQLGGFYLIDVEDLDAALEWGKKIPAQAGAIEVRPVLDYENAGGSTEHAVSEGAAS